jgi:hypothetical protein
MKTKKQTGMMPMPPKMNKGMGSMMGGSPMMRPPMAKPPLPAALTKRPPVMKAKGTALSNFAPSAKKARRRGKKASAIRKQFGI